MDQLPIFVNLKGRNVILVGEGEMADAKRRLIERAGGICVNADDMDARIAFVAIADEDAARVSADTLKARGLLVNVVDRPRAKVLSKLHGLGHHVDEGVVLAPPVVVGVTLFGRVLFKRLCQVLGRTEVDFQV